MLFRRSCSILALSAALGVFLLSGLSEAGGLKRSDSEVKITAEATKPDEAGKQVITLTLNVNKDWYIYANPIMNKTFEPNQTAVRVTAGKKEVDAKLEFPAGITKKTGDESYSIWKGKVTIRAHVTRPADVTGPLDVSVRISACKDGEGGICLLQATVKLTVP